MKTIAAYLSTKLLGIIIIILYILKKLLCIHSMRWRSAFSSSLASSPNSALLIASSRLCHVGFSHLGVPFCKNLLRRLRQLLINVLLLALSMSCCEKPNPAKPRFSQSGAILLISLNSFLLPLSVHSNRVKRDIVGFSSAKDKLSEQLHEIEL